MQTVDILLLEESIKAFMAAANATEDLEDTAVTYDYCIPLLVEDTNATVFANDAADPNVKVLLLNSMELVKLNFTLLSVSIDVTTTNATNATSNVTETTTLVRAQAIQAQARKRERTGVTAGCYLVRYLLPMQTSRQTSAVQCRSPARTTRLSSLFVAEKDPSSATSNRVLVAGVERNGGRNDRVASRGVIVLKRHGASYQQGRRARTNQRFANRCGQRDHRHEYDKSLEQRHVVGRVVRASEAGSVVASRHQRRGGYF
eukprot:9164626-Pyramimonas_sp.AAC.2